MLRADAAVGFLMQRPGAQETTEQQGLVFKIHLPATALSVEFATVEVLLLATGGIQHLGESRGLTGPFLPPDCQGRPAIATSLSSH